MLVITNECSSIVLKIHLLLLSTLLLHVWIDFIFENAYYCYLNLSSSNEDVTGEERLLIVRAVLKDILIMYIWEVIWPNYNASFVPKITPDRIMGGTLADLL